MSFNRGNRFWGFGVLALVQEPSSGEAAGPGELARPGIGCFRARLDSLGKAAWL